MYKNRFCYRISKEAKIGWDNELKEPCEAYVQISIDTEKEMPQELKESMTLKLKKGTDSQMEIVKENMKTYPIYFLESIPLFFFNDVMLEKVS